jgi:hypothetical protein
VGVFAAATDRVLKYDLVTGVTEDVAVTTASDDCCEYHGSDPDPENWFDTQYA